MTVDNIIFALEIIGIVAFAITGVITALEKKFDIFGALVLGTVTSVGGGIIRDMIWVTFLPQLFAIRFMR